MVYSLMEHLLKTQGCVSFIKLYTNCSAGFIITYAHTHNSTHFFPPFLCPWQSIAESLLLFMLWYTAVLNHLCVSAPYAVLCVFITLEYDRETPTHHIRIGRENRIQDKASAAVMSEDSYEADYEAYSLNFLPPSLFSFAHLTSDILTVLPTSTFLTVTIHFHCFFHHYFIEFVVIL